MHIIVKLSMYIYICTRIYTLLECIYALNRVNYV